MLTKNQNNVIAFSILAIIFITPFVYYYAREDPTGRGTTLFNITILVVIDDNSPTPSYNSFLVGLANVGIAATIKTISANDFIARINEGTVGSYAIGGYDIVILNSDYQFPLYKNPIAFMEEFFEGTKVPPTGSNLGFWSLSNNKYLDYLAQEKEVSLYEIFQETNYTRSLQLYEDFQYLWYDVMPFTVSYTLQNLNMFNRNISGIDFTSVNNIFNINNPTSSLETMFLIDPNNSTFNVTFPLKVEAEHFSSILASSIQDEVVTAPVFDSLVGIAPSENILLPETLNNTQWIDSHIYSKFDVSRSFEPYPRLASNLGTFFSENSTYQVQINEDNFWHDGFTVDGNDVRFTLQAHMTPEFNSEHYDTLLHYFGKNTNYFWHEGNFSIEVLDTNSNGINETIRFYLEKYSPSFITDVLTINLLPEHILGDPVDHGIDPYYNHEVRQWNEHPIFWENNPFNTGFETEDDTITGPIGCGSYVFHHYNFTTGEIFLKKFDNIGWNHSSQSWNVLNDNSHFLKNLDNERWNSSPDQVLFKVMDPPISLLESLLNETNVIVTPAQGYDLNPNVNTISNDETVKMFVTNDHSLNGLYFNPKYTAHTQLNDEDHPLARKGVRHAISHLLPRMDLVLNELDYFAFPSYTFLPTNSFFSLNEEKILAFKKNLTATDGSKPLRLSTTAYDEYDIELAKIWMETEGYQPFKIEGYLDRLENPPEPGIGEPLYDVKNEYGVWILFRQGSFIRFYLTYVSITLFYGSIIAVIMLFIRYRRKLKED